MHVVINGTPLSLGEVETIRTAIEGFASALSYNGLGEDAHGKAMTKGYLQNIGTIRDKLFKE